MFQDSGVRNGALESFRAVDKEEVISRRPWAVIRSDCCVGSVVLSVCSLCVHSSLTQCFWLRAVKGRPS